MLKNIVMLTLILFLGTQYTVILKTGSVDGKIVGEYEMVKEGENYVLDFHGVKVYIEVKEDK